MTASGRAQPAPVWVFPSAESAGFLAWHPNRQVVYSVNDAGPGRVRAFAVGADGQLRAVSDQPTGGREACYVAVDPKGEYLVVAHYRSGSLAVLPLAAGGVRIRPVQETVVHGVNPPQLVGSPDGSRIHCVVPSADGSLLLAADLGQDTVTSYRLDRASLKLRGVDRLDLAAGTGPRHLVLNRPGSVIFATCERNSSLLAIRLDRRGHLRLEAQEGSTMTDPGVANRPSDLVLGPLGDRLYVANRGADVITEFAVDGARLEPVQEVSCLGRSPRYLAMVGRAIMIANQDSDNVVQLAPEKRSGVLKPAGRPLSVPSPACIAVVHE